MTKTLDVYIGELCPWPDTVNVIRGKTDETRRYMPEELGTRALLDGAKLMGENRRMRELVRDFYPFAKGHASKSWLAVRYDRMRELGIKVDE